MTVLYDRLPVGNGEYTINVGSKKVFIREINLVSYVGVEDSFVGKRQQVNMHILSCTLRRFKWGR